MGLFFAGWAVKVNGQGNAVLSYTRGGVILWNYHIWVTETSPFINFYATGGHVNGSTSGASGTSGTAAKFMDRNLGALAATTAKPSTALAYKYFGVLYQHGRPTPFSGQGTGETVNAYTVIYNGAATKLSSGSIGGYTQSNTAVSSVTDAIKTPNTYYYWYGAESSNQWTWYKFGDISLWSDYGANKSIYDPCPYGYRVPINGSWNGFSVTPTGQAIGVDVGSTWSSTWWPAAGRRECNGGAINLVGNYGWCWSSTYASTNNSYYLYFRYNGNVNPSDYTNRSYALSVRCVQERGNASRGAWDVGLGSVGELFSAL